MDNIPYLDMPIKKTFSEMGLDQFGQNTLEFFGSEINFKAMTMREAGVPSNFIQGGMVISSLNVGDEKIKIDGENRRITVSDGTNDRIVIGYLPGKF